MVAQRTRDRISVTPGPHQGRHGDLHDQTRRDRRTAADAELSIGGVPSLVAQRLADCLLVRRSTLDHELGRNRRAPGHQLSPPMRLRLRPNLVADRHRAGVCPPGGQRRRPASLRPRAHHGHGPTIDPRRSVGRLTGLATMTSSKVTSGLMRRCWMLALVIALAGGSIAGYALRRESSTPKSARSPYVARYRLEGDGIGKLRFGQTPKAVAAGLERLLGRPVSASAASRIGYFRSLGCGLDHEIIWAGLAARSSGANSDGLTLYFKRSRFVGYSYGCQWPSVSPHWWPLNSPLVAVVCPRWWPSDLPIRGHRFSPAGVGLVFR